MRKAHTQLVVYSIYNLDSSRQRVCLTGLTDVLQNGFEQSEPYWLSKQCLILLLSRRSGHFSFLLVNSSRRGHTPERE